MLKSYKACQGKAFPLKVKGKLLLIKDSEVVSLEIDDLDYVTKVNISRGITDKDIVEVTDKKSQKTGDK